MSTEQTPTETKAGGVKPPTTEDLLTSLMLRSGAERTLVMAAEIVNDSEIDGDGVELDVTLFVSGTILTGTMIGVKKYFREYSSQLGESLPDAPGVAERMRAELDAASETVSRKIKNAREQFHWADPRNAQTWINLRDVRILHPHPAAWDGVFRVRVSAIDAIRVGAAKK